MFNVLNVCDVGASKVVSFDQTYLHYRKILVYIVHFVDFLYFYINCRQKAMKVNEP